MPPTESVAARRVNWSPLAVGIVLVAAFFALPYTFDGIEVRYRPPWNAFLPSELLLWLGASAFLLPGFTLVGVALASHVGAAWSKLKASIDGATDRERALLVVVVGILGVCLAHAGNEGVLEGLPFSDDEYAVKFGGHVLATGHVRARVAPWFVAASTLFLHGRGWYVTATDFPGSLVLAAIAELTRSGTWIYAVLAGLTVMSVSALTMRRFGPRFGLLGAVLAFSSPAMGLLAITSHPHVGSRAFLALGLGALLFRTDRPWLRSLAAGFAFSMAASIRPMEIGALTLPLVLGTALDARRDREARKTLAGLILGALPPLVAVLAYDEAANGTLAWTRLVPNELGHPYGAIYESPLALARLWPRFGGNLAYNLLMLSLFVAGPLGLPMAWIGSRTDPTHRRLAVGVLAALCLALMHDDPGIHAVGPIHYADAMVPLVLLVTAGVKTVIDRGESMGARRSTMIGGIAGYVGPGLLVITFYYGAALGRQADLQQAIYREVERVHPKPAVVLAPIYASVFRSTPLGEWNGTWIMEWRRPLPGPIEPVVILADSPLSRAHVHAWFPDRSVHVLRLRPLVGYRLDRFYPGRELPPNPPSGQMRP